MNKGQFFALGDEGEYHEIGEIKEADTLNRKDRSINGSV